MTKQEREIPDSTTIVEFLASTLALLMAEHRLGGKRWTKNRVAHYISGSLEIEGRISDTTIGRFLDFRSSQDPSPETLRIIAEFLVLMRAMSWEQFDALPDDPPIELASAVQRFYQTSSARLPQFHEDVRGHYYGAEAHGSFFLRTHLILNHRNAAGVLLADELAFVSRIRDPASFHAAVSRLDPANILAVNQALRADGANEVGVFSASGAAVLTDTIGMVLLHATGRGLSSVHTVKEIAFDETDRVQAFATDRNTGWREREEGRFVLPDTVRPDTPVRDVARILGETHSFHRVALDKIRTETLDKHSIKKLNRGEFLDLLNINYDYYETMANEFSGDPDEALLPALNAGHLDEFQQALANGADPNRLPPGETSSLVFSLAADGRLEWVEALIDTGRCDVATPNEQGLLPSHSPGAMARRLAKVPTAVDLMERFARTADILRAEEIRQLVADTDASPVSPT